MLISCLYIWLATVTMRPVVVVYMPIKPPVMAPALPMPQSRQVIPGETITVRL